MTDDRRRPRLDPFAPPSGTVFRFALIIVSASTIALTTLSQVTASWLGVAQADVLDYQNCMMAREHGDANLCHDPRSDAGMWPAVSAVTLFWSIVFVIYWCMPSWRIRRRRLYPLNVDGLLPEIAGYLLDLQREVDVKTRITYLLAPLNPRIDGLAFGRVGRRHIVISGGLAALFARDRQAFRTVLLHELAHLRNHDLDLTFIAVATWRVVVFLLSFRLFAISVNISLGRFPDFGVWAEIATTVAGIFLAVLVPLTRNAVLRSRELYADARTMLWTNGQADLERLFDTYSHRRADRFGRLIRMHPPMKERQQALTDASNLFAFGFWDALSIGAAAALSSIGIAEFLSHPVDSLMNQLGDYVAATCAGVLLAAGVMSSAWRVAMRRFAHREPGGGVDSAGVGVGIGIGVASLGDSTLATLAYRVPTASAIVIIFSWWLVVLLTGWLIVRWSASVARSWIQVAGDRRRPKSVLVGVTALAAIPITIWLYVVVQLRGLAIVGQWINPEDSALAVFLLTILIDIVIHFLPILLLILGLVLLPLAGHMATRRQERGREPSRAARRITSQQRAD